jgi:ubiquinone/menaquinone biosynthesis C-methylase UbiE
MDKFKIQSCFSGAANSYDAAAKVQVQAIDLTLECLDQISRGDNRAKRLLDLGSGTGLSRDKLLLQHKNTYYVALDLSLAMLSYAQHNQKQPETVNHPSICADSAHLPLQNQSFDLLCCSGARTCQQYFQSVEGC